MQFTQVQKEYNIKKLREQIVVLGKIHKVITNKKPSLVFLSPTIGNASAMMIELVIYLEGSNPYYSSFDQDFYNNRQAAMHRGFFSDLHIDIEAGLNQIIIDNNFTICISKRDSVEKIIKNITEKVKDIEDLSTEIGNIKRLAGNHPSFNDYLNTVLNSIQKIDKAYKVECRSYFDGLSILRNKVSHSEMLLSEQEKEKLIKAKLGKSIGSDGKLQMTFEGYQYLIIDIIHFFDKLHASL